MDHRELRELLGSYVLGHLPETPAAAVRAHLEGCAACRAELAELSPLVDDLAGVDRDRVSTPVAPPPDLGERIRAAVAAERGTVVPLRRRPSPRVLAAAAGVALLLGGVLLGFGLDRQPSVPVERLALTSQGPEVRSAGLVAHTWGVEVRLVATGFHAGEVYRASVRTDDGTLLPAGEFIGTGAKRLSCNLQAALLRPDAAGFVVTDADGTPVLSTDL